MSLCHGLPTQFLPPQFIPGPCLLSSISHLEDLELPSPQDFLGQLGSRTIGQEDNFLASSSLGSAGRHRARWARSGHRGSGHVSPRRLCSSLSSSQIVAVRTLASRAFKALHCLHLSAYVYVQSPDNQTPTLLLEASEPGWEKDTQRWFGEDGALGPYLGS